MYFMFCSVTPSRPLLHSFGPVLWADGLKPEAERCLHLMRSEGKMHESVLCLWFPRTSVSVSTMNIPSQSVCIKASSVSSTDVWVAGFLRLAFNNNLQHFVLILARVNLAKCRRRLFLLLAELHYQEDAGYFSDSQIYKAGESPLV